MIQQSTNCSTHTAASVASQRTPSPTRKFSNVASTLSNEAAKILDEGYIARPGDIEVIWTNGVGF